MKPETTSRHIVIKLPKERHKERILKLAREKQLITYKGSLLILAVDFSSETLEARIKWADIVRVLKEKIYVPTKNPIFSKTTSKEEIKTFSDKQNLRECYHYTCFARNAKESPLGVLCLFVCFWPHCVACGILIPWPGIEPMPLALVPWPGVEPVPPALEARSLNHWIAREVLESPLGLNERMVDSNSKMFEEIKISVNINILSIIKPSIFVMMVGNSTFCFLHMIWETNTFLQ